MNIRQIFLLATAAGLIPVALTYGLVPDRSLDYLFDVSVSNVNGTHIFRAIMGLYLALIVFWIMGAYRVAVRQAALYSLVVFMLGLAAGRTLSLVVDGMPNRLLVVYLVLELILGLLGLQLLKKPD
ncbi:MAG TPA: DUF4345 domain-containing protein [Nodosilinea sp.]|nr:DUF4345 domain-containing protein [Nodosilinea sp.]